MALQAGVQTSKVLILMGAGLTGSIVLRSGRLSELIAQLQELLKGADKVEFLPYKCDNAALAAQIKQLAQEIKELALSNPVTIYNGNSSSNGIASYLVPAAAIGAMGYCYMWWKGLSFSDVMFLTKQNMADAVNAVSKQLDQLSQTLNSTKRHLTKKLESLDCKIEEHRETCQQIADNVDEMNANLSQIGFDFEMIQKMVAGLEGKIELIESKQDVTNSGLLYLCQFAGGIKDGLHSKLFEDIGAKLAIDSSAKFEEKQPKGLQFLATNESLTTEKPTISAGEDENRPIRKVPTTQTRIHRSFRVDNAWARDIIEQSTLRLYEALCVVINSRFDLGILLKEHRPWNFSTSLRGVPFCTY